MRTSQSLETGDKTLLPGRRHARGVSTAPIALALLLLCPFHAAAEAEPFPDSSESVRVPTPDGALLVADYYRPPAPSTEGVLLLHARGGRRSEWESLARILAARGFHVLAAELRGLGDSDEAGPPRRGRYEGPALNEAVLAEDGAAAATWLQGVPGVAPKGLFLVGAELGATAAVLAAARLGTPPAGLVLLSPGLEQDGIALEPHLSAADPPFLVLVSSGDAATFDAGRTLYVTRQPACQLWVLDGAARGTRLIASRLGMESDLADWMQNLHDEDAGPP